MENIKSLKQLQPVKEAFLATVGLSDWEEAEKQYNYHTDVTHLQQFVGKDFKKFPKNLWWVACYNYSTLKEMLLLIFNCII